MRVLNCVVILILSLAGLARAADRNLIDNGTLERVVDGKPAGFYTTGGVTFGPLGDPRRDITSRGFALLANRKAGEVKCDVGNLAKGTWYRFTVRGLRQGKFAVDKDDLYLKVAFFGAHGKTAYDDKARNIYEQIETARRDLTVNGNQHRAGAEAWQTYQLDFCLPFPQVDSVTLSVGFGHGTATSNEQSAFLVDDFSLVAIPEPPGVARPATRPAAVVPTGDLLPLGGRWFYAAEAGEKTLPKSFDASNVARLLYRDAGYSAPFAGNASAWLRVGNMDAAGKVLKKDRLVADNVTIRFDGVSMIVHTRGVPNHPTGRFPEEGFGNPGYVREQDSTFYFPLEPKLNDKAVAIDEGNANGALHMGPIGLAVNGVVFFNPFDMGSQDASNLMDRCCGHPNQDGQYHYHKYPICVNSPWADEGKSHSPLLGFAFDGLPLYGPYERENVMAKDLRGADKLNAFNAHYDADRGWHYHVTPGQFPYLLGGYFATEDPRDNQRPRHPPGNGQGPPNGGPPGPRNGPPRR